MFKETRTRKRLSIFRLAYEEAKEVWLRNDCTEFADQQFIDAIYKAAMKLKRKKK